MVRQASRQCILSSFRFLHTSGRNISSKRNLTSTQLYTKINKDHLPYQLNNVRNGVNRITVMIINQFTKLADWRASIVVAICSSFTIYIHYHYCILCYCVCSSLPFSYIKKEGKQTEIWLNVAV